MPNYPKLQIWMAVDLSLFYFSRFLDNWISMRTIHPALISSWENSTTENLFWTLNSFHTLRTLTGWWFWNQVKFSNSAYVWCVSKQPKADKELITSKSKGVFQSLSTLAQYFFLLSWANNEFRAALPLKLFGWRVLDAYLRVIHKLRQHKEWVGESKKGQFFDDVQ